MKLRCVHNSIRLRVRKSDLDNLSQTGSVSESVQFGVGNFLKFTLKMDAAISEVTANFSEQNIEIALPLNAAQDWINSNEVGMENQQSIAGGEQLHLLIEKDFPCLDRVEENKADTFWELAPDKPENC